MGTSIRVSNETKAKLARLKREDESFDDLLNRLVSEEEPIVIGSWDEEKANRAREAVARSRESFGR
jgi:predicted CopG family antitoxin